eukprot:jgi/Ulvmu1/10480/UM064_0017.1
MPSHTCQPSLGEKAVVESVETANRAEAALKAGPVVEQDAPTKETQSPDKAAERRRSDDRTKLAAAGKAEDVVPAAKEVELETGQGVAEAVVPVAVHARLSSLAACEAAGQAIAWPSGTAGATPDDRNGLRSIPGGPKGKPTPYPGQDGCPQRLPIAMRDRRGRGMAASRRQRVSAVVACGGARKRSRNESAAAATANASGWQTAAAYAPAGAATCARSDAGGGAPAASNVGVAWGKEACLNGRSVGNSVAKITTTPADTRIRSGGAKEQSGSSAMCRDVDRHQGKVGMSTSAAPDKVEGLPDRWDMGQPAVWLAGTLGLKDTEEVFLGAAVSDCKRQQPGKRRAAPGLMTLQELQLVQDIVLDADLAKNEADRTARLAVRQQTARTGKQVDRADALDAQVGGHRTTQLAHGHDACRRHGQRTRRAACTGNAGLDIPRGCIPAARDGRPRNGQRRRSEW